VKKTIFVAAALCCSYLCCDNQEVLKWNTAADLPVNLNLKAEMGLPYWPTEADSVILDMADSSFSVYDQMVVFRDKMDTVSAGYHITVVNGYDFDLTFYALFAPFEQGEWWKVAPSNDDVQVLYERITAGGDLPGDKVRCSNYDCDYINLLGSEGLHVRGAGGRDSINVGVDDTQLCDLLLHAPSVAWRWLAKISRNDYDSIPIVPDDEAGKIDARFRVRIKGINNLESLFTF